jgi:gamma-glutamylcyclotransferase (GGCT)/AIG2-like uncharacterized protein YtfP
MMPPSITTTTGCTTVMNKIFVYGTLMAEPVVTTLIGRMPPHDKARVVGYARYPVRDRVYPAIIPVTTTTHHPAAAAVVEGLLLRDLHEREMRRLDGFEGTDYRRVTVRVELLNTAAPVEQEPSSTPTKDESAPVAESSSSTSTTSLSSTLAYMYEWNNPVEMLDTTRPWDYEDFLQNHLDGYVDESELPPPP